MHVNPKWLLRFGTYIGWNIITGEDKAGKTLIFYTSVRSSEMFAEDRKMAIHANSHNITIYRDNGERTVYKTVHAGRDYLAYTQNGQDGLVLILAVNVDGSKRFRFYALPKWTEKLLR